MIIFLYGADDFRSQRFLKELKDKFIREIDPNSISLNTINGATTNFKNILEQINTGSLFVKKRLIIIKNIFKNKTENIFKNLLSYLKKIKDNDKNIIIFYEEGLESPEKLKKTAQELFNFLTKQDYSQKFSILNRKQVLNFIQKEFEKYQKKINSSEALFLAERSLDNLWILSTTIKKLSFYTKEKTIKKSAIEEQLLSPDNENIFKLTDAISSKNKKLTLNLLEEQYAAGLSQEYLITMLIRQFKILLQIKESLEKKVAINKIASYLKLHPFIIKKGIIQSKNFDKKTLLNYINRLVQLDFLNKTGQSDIKTELNLFISEL